MNNILHTIRDFVKKKLNWAEVLDIQKIVLPLYPH